MHARSKVVDSDLPNILEVPELPAPAQPQILEFDMADELPDAIEHREKIIAQALIDLKRRRRAGFIACVVYIALPLVLGFIGRENFPPSMFALPIVVAVYFLVVAYSYRVNKKNFRPQITDFDFVLFQLKYFEKIIELVLSPRFDIVLWLVHGLILIGIILINFSDINGHINFADVPMMFFIGVCIAIVFHLGLLVQRWLAPYTGPNIKLLLLRVFGSSKSAVFTFDRLIGFWKKYGLHFTIDDPDYARHRYRFFQFRTLVLLLIPFFGGLVYFAVIVNDWYQFYKRRPVSNQEQASRRIQKTLARPRDTNDNFKDLRMVAYMNTWKLVVDEFVKVADVVLVDLREYTDKRKGAQYEVDFIFDTFPANRIVFLRDIASNKEAIHRLILDRWCELREGSPNLTITDPEIKVYVSNTQKEHDVQGLMDLLITAAK